MSAVIINTIAIIAGSLIGFLLRRGIPEKITDSLMQALGLCTVIIGVQGCLEEKNILILIINICLGLVIGELTDADGHVNRFAERVTARFVSQKEAGGEGDSSSARLAEAFVTSCLIMNVGAMVIVGSLDAGLRADYTMLYTKSLLDFISGIMMTAAMGIGVMGSAIFTLVFQGGIVLLAEYIAPYMSNGLITEMSCTGSLIIVALGMNMVGITKIKVINYIPALFVVPVVLWAEKIVYEIIDLFF